MGHLAKIFGAIVAGGASLGAGVGIGAWGVDIGIGACVSIGMAVGLSALLPAEAFAADSPVLERQVYDRAAQFLASNQDKLVLNAAVTPHWRRGPQERFTYRRELADGRADFVQVWAETGKRAAAFDQAVVAAGLSKAQGKVIEAQRLDRKSTRLNSSHRR